MNGGAVTQACKINHNCYFGGVCNNHILANPQITPSVILKLWHTKNIIVNTTAEHCLTHWILSKLWGRLSSCNWDEITHKRWCKQLRSAYFSDDERLAVLETSFQREPPRRAPTQLDLNVVEGHELLDRFHSVPLRFVVFFYSSSLWSLCRFVNLV